jgi:diamine N-acetyltransferase
MNDFEIRKAIESDAWGILKIAAPSFLSTHASSAAKEDLDWFINQNYNLEAFKKDIADESNEYYILQFENKIVAYAKLVLHTHIDSKTIQPLTKLDRFYVDPEFVGKGVSKSFFQFIVELSKSKNQKGIWLYTWTGNTRAINFYRKQGFEIVGAFDFPISPNHTNPNHRMLLSF